MEVRSRGCIDRKEFWETFRSCLEELPQRVADVFMLREMEEMETVQLCEALRISQNNLLVMLHRACKALRECLELNWFERKPRLKETMSSVDKSSSSLAKNPSLLTGRNWFERLLVRIIVNRTPKCRDAIKLLSQSMEVKLPITTRIELRFHYLMCLVSALRKTAPGIAETCLFASGARE